MLLDPEELEYSVISALRREHPNLLCQIQTHCYEVNNHTKVPYTTVKPLPWAPWDRLSYVLIRGVGSFQEMKYCCRKVVIWDISKCT